MGTFVTIHVVPPDADAAVDAAFEWFQQIERICSRFDPHSELMALTHRAGEPVPVSTILYEAVQFAVRVADETGGAFDPTVGRRMEVSGFNREHRTAQRVDTGIDPHPAVSYRDVHLDPEHRTVTLRVPLVLDLGAIAKGLAVDMAARELQPFERYAIDAGGDLYLAGRNPDGEPWSVGIRHPRLDDAIVETLRVSNVAVCTSGDYERRDAAGARHHILDARTGDSPDAVASVTVVAPTAMLADALATAAFVLGPLDGIRMLERLGVEGLVVTPALERFETAGWSRHRTRDVDSGIPCG